MSLLVQTPAFLLLLAPLGAVLALRRRSADPAVLFAYDAWLDRKGGRVSWRERLHRLPARLVAAGLALAILALAGPAVKRTAVDRTQGLDILFCLDVSSSMGERDMDAKKDRLQIAKDCIREFLDRRPSDRTGLLAFARFPDLVCPLTTDRRAFLEFLEATPMTGKDGPEDATGIGAALARAAFALRDAQPGRSLILLLTDGEENIATDRNPYEIAPIHAAQLLEDLGLRVHGVALGSGETQVRGETVPIDTAPMRSVAQRTGGSFALAADSEALARVYGEIDRIEPSAAEAERIEILSLQRQATLAALGLAMAAGLLLGSLLRIFPP